MLRGYQSLFLLLTLLWLTPLQALDVPERRKEQYPTQPGHLFVPLPYSMPGIGSGLFLMGYGSNLFNTTGDVIAIGVTGDAEGSVLGVDEVPLFNKHLLLQFLRQDITKAAVNNYETRGMDNGKNDFNIIEVNSVRTGMTQLNWNFYNRRLQLYANYYDEKVYISAIRDAKGKIINKLDKPYKDTGYGSSFAVSLDLTDDYQDPTRGFRLRMDYTDAPPTSSREADYYVLNFNTRLYLPVAQHDSVVLHYYQSDAYVRRRGETDAGVIREELGTDCAPDDAVCLKAEQDLVNDIINARTYGTARKLGGKERLRSYPDGRFAGAHAGFFGVEWRMNFKQEAKPFNYWIWKDVRTGLQWALFAETGSVSESSGDLWQQSRQSYGTGLRLVTGSGSVYRADIATGDEGSEVSVFFFYPWDDF